MKHTPIGLSRRFRNLRHELFFRLAASHQSGLITLGGDYPWTLDPTGMNSTSVVVSAGVGRDIQFEHALANRFNCHIVLLDPSPTGATTMRLPENQRPDFTYLPVGLAAESGPKEFGDPDNPDEGSFVMSRGSTTHSFPCTDLPSLMRERGLNHIDFLKLDIEGFEYGVLDALIRKRIPVRQIGVEFHHWAGGGPTRWTTIRTILRLRACGYRLIHRYGWDLTFLRSA
mgnify:CR=1 FL=1